MSENVTTAASAAVVDKKRSQWKEVWRRLRQNKMAMLGLGILIFLVIIALSADLLFPRGFDDQVISRRFQMPNKEFWFGTDNFGRGILDRMVHGARVSLSVGLFAVSISIVFGGLLGAAAAGGVYSYVHRPKFGELPSGERLRRMQASPHYHGDHFENLVPVPVMSEDEGGMKTAS